MEVIILAGGFGTRLQSVVKDVPKPMADINGKPFLEYILEYLSGYNVTNIVISVGYKQDVIKSYFKSSYKGIPLCYSCEDEPLGTGGAIKKSLNFITTNAKNVLVMNGDTFFEVDLAKLEKIDNKFKADITISLIEMRNFDRYGAIKVESNIVKKFEEKKFYEKAYINGGVYMIKKNIFNKFIISNKFSFEEFLEKNLTNMKVCPYISNNSYFIDIGIPSDYEKAKIDFQNKLFS